MSQRRKPLKKTNDRKEFENISYHEDDLDKSQSSRRKSSLKRGGRSISPLRKSVNFKDLIDEFNPNYSISQGKSQNKMSRGKISRQTSSSRRSPSFGANYSSGFDENADFEEIDFEGSIPIEGKRSIVRGSEFSASKDKTRASVQSFLSPHKPGLTITPNEYR